MLRRLVPVALLLSVLVPLFGSYMSACTSPLSLAAARAANAQALSAHKDAPVPVALFVGGTSGLGQATAEAFARHTHGNAHIIICGRNREAAERIIASFPAPSAPGAKHEFVPCEATLMKSVRDVTQELSAKLGKINYLVLTQGILTTKGRDETPEGIDKKLALHYYSRWRFTHDLAPLLGRASESGEAAKMLSVLAPGHGGPIDLADLGLRKHYSLRNAASSAPTYNDLMIESFATRYPAVSFTHAYPGVVRTPLLHVANPVLRPFNPLFSALITPFSHAQDDAGEYMLAALLQGERGSCRRGACAEDLGRKAYYCTDEARERLWEHSVQETARG